MFGAKPPPQSELEQRLKVPPGFQVALFAGGHLRTRANCKFTPTGDLLGELAARGRGVPARARRERRRPRGRRAQAHDRPREPAGDGDRGRVALRRRERRGEAGEASTRRARASQGGRGPCCRACRPAATTGASTSHQGPDGWIYLTIGSELQRVHRGRPAPRHRSAGSSRVRPDYETLRHRPAQRGRLRLAARATGPCTRPTTGATCSATTCPPCELDKVEQGGSTAGRSCWATATSTRTSVRQGRRPGGRGRAPGHAFGAHVAPLGIRFYRGTRLPERYRGQAFAALHGSWNRTKKSGYKVVLLEWKPDGSIAESDFLTGFEAERGRDRPAGRRAGRPRTALSRVGRFRRRGVSGEPGGGRLRVESPAMSGIDPAEADRLRAAGMAIALHAAEAPERMAILSRAGDLTYAELNAGANRLARGAARARSVAAATRVALFCSEPAPSSRSPTPRRCAAGLRLTPLNWHLQAGRGGVHRRELRGARVPGRRALPRRSPIAAAGVAQGERAARDRAARSRASTRSTPRVAAESGAGPRRPDPGRHRCSTPRARPAGRRAYTEGDAGRERGRAAHRAGVRVPAGDRPARCAPGRSITPLRSRSISRAARRWARRRS